MPIKPPNLDDRKYADIVREARALIPQYCPEWTNLGDADPGITLVQLFGWMTEMTIYRLNRVPDKTYIHFLNFIGEERREARPSQVPLTFELRTEGATVAEIPPFTRCSTKQKEGTDALHFLTTEALTLHDCNVTRIVSVHAGIRPTVREIPFDTHPEVQKAVIFGRGAGVQMFKMDPVEHGPRAYTPFQYLYIAHDDFRIMDFKPKEGQRIGRVRLRSASAENLPIASLFKWEYRSSVDIDNPWQAIPTEEEEEDVVGLPEITLKSHLPQQEITDHFGSHKDKIALPEAVKDEKYWIRGVIEYERWLAERMEGDLEITWRDDRGGEERPINNWEVRAVGRNLEFFVQDMPPIRGGWTVRLTMVDRNMPAGRNSYLPRYRWLYRRGEQWEVIPNERVRYQGTAVVITGPLNEMASDGYNLRAERVETVFVRGFLPDLELEMTWLRPVEVHLAAGPETGSAGALASFELPATPFQPAPTMPAMLGYKFFIGSDLLENRAQKPVVLEVEVGFEYNSNLVEEQKELYRLQLCYRAADSWRVVYTAEGTYNDFTFADLDPDGADESGRRKITLKLDPRENLKGIYRAIVAGQETCWLRFEMQKAALTHAEEKNEIPAPISLKIFGVRMGFDGLIGKDTYEQPMPGAKVATVSYREQNRRLTRVLTRAAGRLSEDYPFDTFIDINDDGGAKDAKGGQGHHALYFQFDKPFPAGNRHAITFKTRGETYLPEGHTVDWELLESSGPGRLRWSRIGGGDDTGYRLNRSGVLTWPYPDPVEQPPEGTWLRALVRAAEGDDTPALPPISHVLLNTIDGVNLHTFRMEKFSGLGVPHQSVQLRRFPVFLHGEESEHKAFANPDRFPDIRVFVVEEDAQRREWRRAPGNSLLTASKDDRVFVVDSVEGSLTFGNGIRGKMVPVGNFNIIIEHYHTVPGDAGNVRAGAVQLCEGFNDICSVVNLLPAAGGRNAESIDEIIRRAPSVLTSRDRAVTRLDFEIIAKESSGEVARAACDGRMTADGQIGIVILPQRREGERVPDPFLSAGLKDHVQRYLSRRCLVNVAPQVRLATFQEVDVSVTLRLRPNANIMLVREKAKSWVEQFLDPYDGGLDFHGWPFTGTLYAQDFGRMVTFIPEIRHVMDVQLFAIGEGRERSVPGWEQGVGESTIVLEKDDLFVVRRVRIRTEEDES